MGRGGGSWGRGGGAGGGGVDGGAVNDFLHSEVILSAI